MISRDYLDAVISKPFRVMGMALKPFSVGHVLLLEYINSPVARGADMSIEDLANAIMICSMTFEQNIESWKSKGLRYSKRIWGERVGMPDMEKVTECYKEYLDYYMRWPNIDNDDCHGKAGSPGPALMIDVLMDIGYSESEALNMPYNRAAWCVCARQERIGAITVNRDIGMSEAELADAQRLADELHDRIKKQNG